MRAFGALFEIRLAAIDGLPESFVVGRSLDGAFDLISIGSHPTQDATKEPSGSPQCASRHPGSRGLEFGHKTVAAPVAEKLELKSFISRMISVVPGKLNECHFRFSPPGAK